jgi:hypothetical protein
MIPANLTRNAIALWTGCYGEVKIERYDLTRNGAHYIAKLASQSGFDYLLETHDRLDYNGPEDLLAAAKKNPYLPQHVKVTPVMTRLFFVNPIRNCRLAQQVSVRVRASTSRIWGTAYEFSPCGSRL